MAAIGVVQNVLYNRDQLVKAEDYSVEKNIIQIMVTMLNG